MARGRDNTIQASGRPSQPPTDHGARAPSEARLHPPYQHRQAHSLTTQVRRAASSSTFNAPCGWLQTCWKLIVFPVAFGPMTPALMAVYLSLITTSPLLI